MMNILTQKGTSLQELMELGLGVETGDVRILRASQDTVIMIRYLTRRDHHNDRPNRLP